MKNQSITRLNNQQTAINLTNTSEDQLLQILGHDIPKKNKKSNIVYLLIDCSGSMAFGNKITQVKNGVIDFSQTAIKKGYAIGIITFSCSCEEIYQPNTDLILMKKSLDTITAHGFTNMTEAIITAIEKIINFSGEKVICIATDGMPNSRESALNAANKAKGLGIKIMVIGTDDADKDFLNQIASSKELATKVSSSEIQIGFETMKNQLKLPPPK